jgi:hypothetical protein
MQNPETFIRRILLLVLVCAFLVGAATTSFALTRADIPLPAGTLTAVADFNNDNFPDFALSNHSGNVYSITLVLSDGVGGYLAPGTPVVVDSTPPSSFNGISFYARDFDNDGKVDLAAFLDAFQTNPGQATIIYLPGNGNGTFGSPVTSNPAGSVYTVDVEIGDFNHDSKLDFAFCTFGPGISVPGGGVQLALNNGSGGFTNSAFIGLHDAAQSMTVGDFNLDGKDDLVVQSQGASCSSDPTCFAATQVMLGNGTGGFAITYLTSPGLHNMKTGDFNNDGKPDIVSDQKIVVGDGAGNLNPSTSFSGSGVGIPQPGDFDHDGNLDFATLSPINSQVSIYYGNGGAGIARVQSFVPGGGPGGLFVADFNHNGQIDLGVYSVSGSKITIYYDGYVSLQHTQKTGFDFDGDGRSDIGVTRNVGGVINWFWRATSDSLSHQTQMGSPGDIFVPADYNNDGITNFAVFRPSTGTWYTSDNPATGFEPFQWGTNGDLPVPGDYDGDGYADYAVFRPSNGTWYIRMHQGGAMVSVQWGLGTDKPMPADYDGDGKTDIAVYRAGAAANDPSYWYILKSSDGSFLPIQFGSGEDKPVPGDYRAEGAASVAVFRPSTGTWYTSTNPAIGYGATHWGQTGDIPVTMDFDGDGKNDLAVFRPATSTWYILQTANGVVAATAFGVSTDRPIPQPALN